ncbi:MAG: hypothetical protein AAGA00_00115 [Pseudomonadota bacterium]
MLPAPARDSSCADAPAETPAHAQSTAINSLARISAVTPHLNFAHYLHDQIIGRIKSISANTIAATVNIDHEHTWRRASALTAPRARTYVLLQCTNSICKGNQDLARAPFASAHRLFNAAGCCSFVHRHQVLIRSGQSGTDIDLHRLDCLISRTAKGIRFPVVCADCI